MRDRWGRRVWIVTVAGLLALLAYREAMTDPVITRALPWIQIGSAHVSTISTASMVSAHQAVISLSEITAPANAHVNQARLYVDDNGSGKSRLVVIFGTGAAQVLATEP